MLGVIKMVITDIPRARKIMNWIQQHGNLCIRTVYMSYQSGFVLGYLYVHIGVHTFTSQWWPSLWVMPISKQPVDRSDTGREGNKIIVVLQTYRSLELTDKGMTVGVYGTYSNNSSTAEANLTDACGRSELLKQCSDKSTFACGFQLPVAKHPTDYFISVSYRWVSLYFVSLVWKDTKWWLVKNIT